MSNLPKKLQEISDRAEKASPGEWGARVNEFSNLARARFIWDSTWGFVGEFHGSQAEVNADFVANAKQDIPRLVKALELALYYIEGDATYEGVCKQIEAILEGE